MLKNPSLITRIAVGEAIGFTLALIGIIILPYLWEEVSWFFRIGIVLWYTTLGGIIGVFGVITYHPVLKLPLPWWVRSSILGAWMNFVLTFFAYEQMQAALVSMFGENGILTSPFWFVLEGGVIGLIMGYFATKFGGEGKEAAGQ